MQRIQTYMPPCPQSLSPSMPTTGLLNSSTLYKKPAHCPDDSDELGVFEATKYFAGAVDGLGFGGGVMKKERVAIEAKKKNTGRPVQGMLAQELQGLEKHTKNKRPKQPNSPAARLANFLSSLFNQTASKRRFNCIISTPTPINEPLKGEKEVSLARSTTRSSASHSQSIRSSDSRSIYSCSSSVPRNPSLYPNTPRNVHKELNCIISTPTPINEPLKGEKEVSLARSTTRSSASHSQSIRSSDSRSIYSCSSSVPRNPSLYPNTPRNVHKELSSYPKNKCNKEPKSVTFCPQSEVGKDKRITDMTYVAEKIKHSDRFFDKNNVLVDGRLKRLGRVHGNNWFVENKWVLNRVSDGFVRKDGIWAREFASTEEVEENGESDSSSDLFELKNFDLGDSSSGLPVYGTT